MHLHPLEYINIERKRHGFRFLIRDNKRSVSCFFSKFLFEHESLKKLCHKLIKHVWTGLQTRPSPNPSGSLGRDGSGEPSPGVYTFFAPLSVPLGMELKFVVRPIRDGMNLARHFSAGIDGMHG